MSGPGYCESPFFYQRRTTREVVVGDPAKGGVIIGGGHPVAVQSMITCDTMDTAACVRETLELVKVGCQLVRITAPTVKDAANLKNFVSELRTRGCQTPIAADIHFKPEAALEAVKWVEKIRVNPGNYADSKKFAIKEYSEHEYAVELARMEERFAPLVKQCKELRRAMRIGVNHGSLSDRIMNRYGDTPTGMVESALEFARIARKYEFHNFCFSMKASNPKVVIECYRLLVSRLAELGADWNYPLHLGVTEAGEGEDGRIKSAIGIGSLLVDGLGDTIRVSLTEDSPNEIPVCRDLLAQVEAVADQAPRRTEDSAPSLGLEPSYDPFIYERRHTAEVALGCNVKCGGAHPVRVVVARAALEKLALQIRPKANVSPEAVYEEIMVREIDPSADFEAQDSDLLTVKDGIALRSLPAFRLLAAKLQGMGKKNPILLKDSLGEDVSLPPCMALLRASMIVGSLLADGIGDAVFLRLESDPSASLRLAYNILQAVGCRSFKTDYVACPSCGRTLFHLQTVTARIKSRTQHLKGVKIAIMGCIVNGPGEMADADFGYVGGAPGKVNLYVGKTPVKFNIPETEAVDRLVDLIREQGKWVEPA
jgi:(E)-4-hydroxy-3-methylbut-2-enyl-diphosphate synthase